MSRQNRAPDRMVRPFRTDKGNRSERPGGGAPNDTAQNKMASARHHGRYAWGCVRITPGRHIDAGLYAKPGIASIRQPRQHRRVIQSFDCSCLIKPFHRIGYLNGPIQCCNERHPCDPQKSIVSIKVVPHGFNELMQLAKALAAREDAFTTYGVDVINNQAEVCLSNEAKVSANNLANGNAGIPVIYKYMPRLQ